MNTEKSNIKGSMGGYGGEIQTTGTYTGNFCAIQVLSEAVITATGNIDNFSAVTLLDNAIVVGEFTSITIASGTCVLYNNIDGG